MDEQKQLVTVQSVYDALDAHLAKISETKRRHSAEMDELFMEGRTIQSQVLEMLLRERAAGASKS